jgi:hypothetical protein
VPGTEPYMIILTDSTGHCGGCTTTVERDFTYKVMVAPGQPWEGPTGSGSGAICETNKTSNWNCQPSASVQTSACGDPGLFVWNAYAGLSSTGSVAIGGMSGFVHTDAVNVNGSTAVFGTSGQLANTCINQSGPIPCPH